MSVPTLSAFRAEVEATYKRIAPHLYKTPLMHSHPLGALAQRSDVYVKLESEQVTGSFKVRGALSKVSILAQDEKTKLCGATTASTGNHALACNYASKKLGVQVQTYAPCDISATKEAGLRALGVDLIKHGQDCMEAELRARAAAQEGGKSYISPYNDYQVMLGQATVGLEIYDELPEVDSVLVSVGGGGLIGGIATYLKARNPKVKVIGCQPQESKVMYESIKAGKIIFEESGETLSDGTKGGIEEGSLTFEPCRDHVDEWIMVTEEQIAKAVYFMLEQHHKVVEGAAGVAVGAFLAQPQRFCDQRVAIVACGSSIGVPTLRSIIDTHCAQ